jgi:peptide/nickel transport system permease protein
MTVTSTPSLESVVAPVADALPIARTEVPAEVGVARRRGHWWSRLPWPARIALVFVALIVVMAVLAPVLAPHDPNTGRTADRLGDFGFRGHVLGTDGQGRDVLSRLIWGARPSLLSGLIPVAFGTVVGTLLGLVAGLGGRRVNSAIMRVLDVFYAFPAILLAITVAAVLGSGTSNAIIALAIILVPPIARVAESEVSRIRHLDFMEAAQASGATRIAIARKHVLPNVAPAILVYGTALVGLSIVYAAGLSFLGLGVKPPTAEWGLMLSDLRQYIFTAPGLAMVPAVAILVASVAFNVLGDGLRDVFDVRSAGRS